MNYFKKIFKKFVEKYKEILYATAVIWLVIPVIIFIIYCIYLIIAGITSEGLIQAIKIAVDVSLPWWVSIIVAPWKTLIEVLIILFIVINYYTYLD
jgi:hypothetical protein